MNRARLLLIGTVLSAAFAALAPSPAATQVPPFFGGGGGIFDPEIDVVSSGVILDAQATVSADRKYVTMTTRTSSTELLALREFAFQVGGGGAGNGFVGGAGQDGAAAGAAANLRVADDAARANGPAHPNNPGARLYQRIVDRSILDRRGMTLLGRVGQ